MSSQAFLRCYHQHPFLLTEGAIGLRVSNEFGIKPDLNIRNASLIYDAAGRKAIETIYGQYLQVAQDYALPIILSTNTRRVNRDNLLRSDYKDRNVIQDYAQFLREITVRYSCEAYVGGMLGCKGDGYTGQGALTRQEARAFHAWQVEAITQSDVDFIFPILMPTLEETLGMADLIEQTEFPYMISLMIRDNGTIIDGHTIHDAIACIDTETKRKPICYITNCVHPRILLSALEKNDTPLVRERFKGIEANAACMPPEQLDCATHVITSDPASLAEDMVQLHSAFPMKIVGGCCGTDQTHIRALAERFRAIERDTI